MQLPPEQVWSLGQTRPQAPQFCESQLSIAEVMQTPLQDAVHLLSCDCDDEGAEGLPPAPPVGVLVVWLASMLASVLCTAAIAIAGATSCPAVGRPPPVPSPV